MEMPMAAVLRKWIKAEGIKRDIDTTSFFFFENKFPKYEDEAYETADKWLNACKKAMQAANKTS
jgi:hypothetical protein